MKFLLASNQALKPCLCPLGWVLEVSVVPGGAGGDGDAGAWLSGEGEKLGT